MLLSQAQIKEEELKLLQISDFGLAQYCNKNTNTKIFKDMPTITQHKQLERLKIIKMQSSGLSSNANLKAMVIILLKIIYQNDINQDLLNLIKSSIYSPTIDLTEIKNHPLQLSNEQMKKLVVQFFYSLSYSQFTDRVDTKLSKYSIIMQILILYFRTLLKQLGLHKAQNYVFRLPNQQVFGMIIQYFDLNCKQQGKLYLFFQDRMFIYSDCHNQILLGHWIENNQQITSYNKVNRFVQFEDQQENPENQWSKYATKGFNRSLQLRGIVSESTMFEHLAPTPFFNFDQDSCTSFQSSKQASLVGNYDDQKNSFIKMQREVSLLKQKDRMTGSQQMGLGEILSMKRTLIQNEFKVKNDSLQEEPFSYGYGFGMNLQNQITLDSPHTLEIPSDRIFGQQVDKFQKLKQMKKSKSQKKTKTMLQDNNQDLPRQHISQCYRGLIYQSKQKSEFSKQFCNCVQSKKQKLQLNSHLYQLNLTVSTKNPDFSKKNPQNYQIPCTTSVFHKNNLVFTRGKSISGLQKILKEKFNSNSSISYKLQKSGRILLNVVNDQSHSTFSARATYSRRQYSPLSSIDRPLSPFGGQKSITVTSPKIKFNYKNPLKYSACMKKILNKPTDKK